MNDLSYKLLGNSDNERKSFRALHNTIFSNTNMSKDWMDWYFTDQVRMYCAFDNTKIVGMWCVEPKELLLNDKESISVGRCFSVGIDSNYRRRNIFVELSQFAIEEERKQRNYEYIVGFPQAGRSVIGGHYKAGWEKVQDIDVRSFTPNSNVEQSLTELNAVSDFVYMQRFPYVGSFLEDHDYLNKRWIHHPDNRYVIMSKHSQANIIMKVYGDVCHILDVQGTKHDVAVLLHSVQVLCYKHRWKELNIWCATNDAHFSEVVDTGFVQGSDYASSIEMLAVKINASEKLSFDSTHFQMGTEEIY
jgi:hypothetical protein